MAILAIVSEPQIKKEQYELLRKEVNWEHQQPEGMIFHSACFDSAGGIRVTDVWTTQEAMDKFFETRLIPAMRKLKITPPTKKDVYPLYAAVVGTGIEQFRAIQYAH